MTSTTSATETSATELSTTKPTQDGAGPQVHPVQVHRVYIKTTPEAIWEAITSPEWSQRYGYGGQVHYDLRPGGAHYAETSPEMRAMGAPDIALDGEVLEVDPPRRLVVSWRMVMDDGLKDEGFSRLTYEIEPIDGGVCRLTLTHDLEDKPKLQLLVSGGLESSGAGGGWPWVLSDLKSVLETGSRMAG
jgi:uncharacterized protein YndB with AHSA1/START domain